MCLKKAHPPFFRAIVSIVQNATKQKRGDNILVYTYIPLLRGVRGV